MSMLKAKNSVTNQGPGLPSRDRVEIWKQVRTWGMGGKKVKVFLLKNDPPKYVFYIDLKQYQCPSPITLFPSVSTP